MSIVDQTFVSRGFRPIFGDEKGDFSPEDFEEYLEPENCELDDFDDAFWKELHNEIDDDFADDDDVFMDAKSAFD